MFSLVTLTAYAILGVDALQPDAFWDFAPDSPALATLEAVLKEVPVNGELTYLGIIRNASRRSSEMNEAVRAARESRDAQDPVIRNSIHRTVASAVKLHSEAIDYTATALELSVDDPIKLLVVARSVAILIDSLPTRADLEPVEPATGTILDSATSRLHLLAQNVLRAGVNLREKTATAHGAADVKSELKRRDLARALVAAVLSVRDQRLDRVRRAIETNVAVKAVSEWLNDESCGVGHAPAPAEVRSLLVQTGPTPAFSIADSNAMVPWPFALAQNMGLGDIVIGWTTIGIDPANSGAESNAVRPRLNLEARFRFKHGNTLADLPIYSIRLNDVPVDRFTLNDEAGYRTRLKQYLAIAPAAPAEVLAMVDLPNITEARQKLAGSAGKDRLAEFDKLASLALGQNEVTYELANRMWSAGRLESDLYWLVRVPGMRDRSPPAPPAPAPGAPAPGAPAPGAPAPGAPAAATPPTQITDYTEAWLKQLNVRNRFVDTELALNVTPIAVRLREEVSTALREAMRSSDSADIEARKKLREAESELLNASGDSNRVLVSVVGNFDRLISSELSAHTLAVENALRARLPVWLAADRMFDVPQEFPDANVAEESIASSRLSDAVAELWNLAEKSVTERSELMREVPGWPQFLHTLQRIEDSSIRHFGASFIRQISSADTSRSALGHPLMSGYVSAKSDRSTEGLLLASNHFVALERRLAVLERRFAVAADQVLLIQAAMAEIRWLQATISLSDNAVWQAYAAECRTGPKDAPATPALPDKFAAESLGKCTERRGLLIAACRKWLTELEQNDYLAEVLKLRIDAVTASSKRFDGVAPPPGSDETFKRVRKLWADAESLRSLAQGLSVELAMREKDPKVASDTMPRLPSAPTERDFGNSLNRLFESWIRHSASVAQVSSIIKKRSSDESQEWRKAWKGMSTSAPSSPADEPDALYAANVKSSLADILVNYAILEKLGIQPGLARRAAIAKHLAESSPPDPSEAYRRELRKLCAGAGIVLNPSLSAKVAGSRIDWGKALAAANKDLAD